MISPHNPFPGMNPFLERSWSDVHTQLIAYIRDELALRGLPAGLRARAEERLSVELAIPKIVLREPGVERWIEICSEHGKLITVIELLSLANKPSPGRERYLQKRLNYESAQVNVVEIDLLRGGSRVVAAMAEPWSHPSEATRYSICVRRATPDRYEVYHWRLRERIPAISFPCGRTTPMPFLICNRCSIARSN
jgi:hypothetical protein